MVKKQKKLSNYAFKTVKITHFVKKDEKPRRILFNICNKCVFTNQLSRDTIEKKFRRNT